MSACLWQTETMGNSSEEILEFPCRFPVKAMGKNAPDFAAHVESLICAHVDDPDNDVQVQLTASRAERYLSVTVTLTATSRAQLDAIYQTLTDDHRIIMAL